jgi:acetolactate synthase-1/2/3 large subunit
MGETIEMINKHSKGDAIMVSDVGQHQMFTVVILIQFF